MAKTGKKFQAAKKKVEPRPYGLADAVKLLREVRFAIPFKAHPAAHDTLLQLFTNKWGQPRPSEADGKRILIFRDGDPRVEAIDDIEHDAWQIEIRR
jgi:hypothetical protein